MLLVPFVDFHDDSSLAAQAVNGATNGTTGTSASSPLDLMFRAIDHLFGLGGHGSTNRPTSAAHTPPARASSFATRLSLISLHLSNPWTLRALTAQQALLSRFPHLESFIMQESEIPARTTLGEGGWYGNFLLMGHHGDERVRVGAKSVADFTR